jgi:hypothetical protein
MSKMKDTRASLISACVFSALIFFVCVGAARAQAPSPTPAGDVYVLEPEGSVGTKYENRIEMQGMFPVKWEVVKGNLPEGIVLVPTNGTLFGWPSGPAKSYEFTLKVTDSAGKEALYQLEWAINAATPGPLLRKKGEPRAQTGGGSGGSSSPRGGGGGGGGAGGQTGGGEKAAAKPTLDRPLTENADEVSGFMPVKNPKSVTLELYPATAEKAEPPAKPLSERPVTVGTDGRFTLKLDKRLARGQKMRLRVEPAEDKAANIFSDPVEVERETAVLTPLYEGTKEIKGIADKSAGQVYAELEADGVKRPLGVGTVNRETGAFSIPLEKALTRQDKVFVYREGTAPRRVSISDTRPPVLKSSLMEGAITVSGYSPNRSARVVVEVLPDAESNDPVHRTNPQPVGVETGEFSVNLPQALAAGQRVRAQVENTEAWSPEKTVEAVADWGRVRGYFGVGMMLSNGGGEDFSRRDLYLNFNLDSNWYHRPRYSDVMKEGDQTSLANSVLLRFEPDVPEVDGATNDLVQKKKLEAQAINDERDKLEKAFTDLETVASFSDAERMEIRHKLILESLKNLENNASLSSNRRRLIRQVADKLERPEEKSWDIHFNTFFDARLTPVPVAGQSSAGNAGTDDFGNFIANKKGVLMQVGAYAPIFNYDRMTWTYQGSKNALFVGPLVRAGVQTLFDRRGLADASVFEDNDLFNFFALGARLGHYRLSGSDDRAPRLISYLDIGRGRWQNLERRVPTGDRDPNGGEIFVRKRPWRWALEGRLKIPSLPFQIGFDSNIGEGPDDMRFLIGTNFDIDNLFRYLRR